MKTRELKEKILSLPALDRERLLKEVERSLGGADLVAHASRRHVLDNKMGHCPHCSHGKYVRFGKDKGAQRYKCKSCRRSFTEYTGTWMARLQRKDKVGAYLEMMMEEKSLDKISATLDINKKTAFDWRHKILAALGKDGEDGFTGITESDETFFLRSEKGMAVKGREPRKRGGKSDRRGVNDDHVAVIATQDRKSALGLTVATLGRIGKADIESAIGDRLEKGSAILCTDAHRSYNAFARDIGVEYHPLNASKGERVKEGVYHVQHVNSTHNRLKKWIGNTFWGVSTKYLQQYLDWHRAKERIKRSRDRAQAFVRSTMEDAKALERYRRIGPRYENLISTLN